MRMGSVWTHWVQRSVNGLGVNALVVSVKRKIQNLQGSCPLTRKEVVDAEVAMVSVHLGDGHQWCPLTRVVREHELGHCWDLENLMRLWLSKCTHKQIM